VAIIDRAPECVIAGLLSSNTVVTFRKTVCFSVVRECKPASK
jgi:hypothetical protein